MLLNTELSLQSLSVSLWFKIMYGVMLFKEYTLHAEHIVNLYLFLQTCITMPNLTNLLFIFLFVCMGVLPVYVCAWCLRRSPGIGIQLGTIIWVLGTESWSSGKTASAPNC